VVSGRGLALVVVGVLVGALAGVFVVLHVVTLIDTAGTTRDPVPITDPMTQDYDTMRLAAEHRCSADGTDGVIPGGAIVWRDGQAVMVTFDEGWSVYTSGEGGVLLAVCAEGPG
jgi:hypothetical protein